MNRQLQRKITAMTVKECRKSCLNLTLHPSGASHGEESTIETDLISNLMRMSKEHCIKVSRVDNDAPFTMASYWLRRNTEYLCQKADSKPKKYSVFRRP